MLVNKRRNIIGEVIRSLRADLKSTGKISRENSKVLLKLSREALVEVVERFGHSFIFDEYECTNNAEIVNRLLNGVGLADVSYVSFKDFGSIVFKTGHILSRKGNKLQLKNCFEQTLIGADLTGNYEIDKGFLDIYLNIISGYREFEDIKYVEVLAKPLLLATKDKITV